jgi:hypothetical protein
MRSLSFMHRFEYIYILTNSGAGCVGCKWDGVNLTNSIRAKLKLKLKILSENKQLATATRAIIYNGLQTA